MKIFEVLATSEITDSFILGAEDEEQARKAVESALVGRTYQIKSVQYLGEEENLQDILAKKQEEVAPEVKPVLN